MSRPDSRCSDDHSRGRGRTDPLPRNSDELARGTRRGAPPIGTVAGMNAATAEPVTPPRRSAVLRRWPSALGLAAAILVLVPGTDDETPAVFVGIAALCYLAAAALSKPWVAWPAIVGGSLVVVASELLGLAWWAGIGIAALALVVVGLLLGASRPALSAQTIALIGFGGLAAAALLLAPPVGLAVAGTVLASHALWDVSHYRGDRVVPRSLAEFCMVLDLVLGVGCIGLAIVG